jgi:hypothetical protein
MDLLETSYSVLGVQDIPRNNLTIDKPFENFYKKNPHESKMENIYQNFS